MAIGVAGCSSKLDEHTAINLLMKQEKAFGNRYCTWNVPRRHSSVQGLASMVRARALLPGDSDLGTFAFPESGPGGQGKCAAALEAAGRIKRGECVTPGCGGCCNRALAAGGLAQLRNDDAEPGGPNAVGRLEFVCGHVAVIRVISITTEGGRGTVKYVQGIRFDKELDGLEAAGCRIERPLGLEESGERTHPGFVRDDTGRWTLQYPLER